MNRRRLLSTLSFAALSLTGAVGYSAAHASDLSGAWQGRWNSCTTGHNGILRATFCRISATQYRVDFRGRFFKVLPFRYSVVLNVVSEYGDTVRLRGSSYLGRRFGTFHYDAVATACRFDATYTSCKDNGRFRMTKCG